MTVAVLGQVRQGFDCGRRSGRRPARGQCPVCTSVSSVLTCVTDTDFVLPDSAGWCSYIVAVSLTVFVCVDNRAACRCVQR